jgi:hypothetical protein
MSLVPHDYALLIIIIREGQITCFCVVAFSIDLSPTEKMASQSNPGLLGLDRTNTSGHPDTCQPIRSTNVPSTASRSSAGKRKAHFESGSVAESSGTPPTSVGSAPGPELITVTHEHGNLRQAGFDHHCPNPHEQLYDNLTGLGGHLPEIKHPEDFDKDVEEDVDPLLESLPRSYTTAGPPVSTTAQPPVSEINAPCRSRTQGWTRRHIPGTTRSPHPYKALVDNSPAKKSQRRDKTPTDMAPEVAEPGDFGQPIHTFRSLTPEQCRLLHLPNRSRLPFPTHLRHLARLRYPTRLQMPPSLPTLTNNSSWRT